MPATVVCVDAPLATAALPGHDLVAKGVADLDRGVESVEALLVSIGSPRLRQLGVAVQPVAGAEQRLYRLLAEEHGDAAHSRYNGLIRRLVSFERAATVGLRDA
jgi:hypothetical protein